MTIIDLTMTLEEGMQTFPTHWHPFFEITQLGRHGQENRETRKFTMGTHTGTHIDAPRHFLKDGITVEDIDLNQLCGPATVVNFSQLEDFTEVSVSMLKEALEGVTPERVIFRYDWDRHIGTNKYYTDLPYLSEEACQWLVKNGCKLVAMDTPMPDNPRNGKGSQNDSPNHKILLGSNVVIVEYLVNLKSVSKKNVNLVVAPLKLKDGDGAPVRCFVWEKGND